MDNLLTYLAWAGERDFDALALNELDMAVFCQLVYLPFGAAFEGGQKPSLSGAVKTLEGLGTARTHEVFLRKRLLLGRKMAASPRFGQLELRDYINDVSLADQRQFCAVSITLPGGGLVLAFKGTDGTLVGWKENFNMSFESPVSAQLCATSYLNQAAKTPGVLWLTGHSKGGNLAVWAGAFCEEAVQARIRGIYSFDGPGLSDEAVDTPGYRRISGRIAPYLPQDSLVGILLNNHKPYKVVNSRAQGILQHDLFTWETEPDQLRFVCRESLTRTALLMEDKLNQWLGGIPLSDRQLVCDTVYQVLTSGDQTTLEQVAWPGMKAGASMYKAMQGLDPAISRLVNGVLWRLFSNTLSVEAEAALQTVKEMLPWQT